MADPFNTTTIRKNSRDEIRVALQEWKGAPIASIRVWFQAPDGTMRPGKEGLNFRIGLLAEVTEALAEALKRARDAGLVE